MLDMREKERLGCLRKYIWQNYSIDFYNKMMRQAIKAKSMDDFTKDVREAFDKAEEEMLKHNKSYRAMFGR